MNTDDNAERLIELIPKIYQTINSHFSAYIQNSIKDFFNDRRELIKEAQKYASELRSDSEKLLNFINASMIGIITAIFSGAFGLSKGEKWFLFAAFGFHALLFLFSYLFNRKYINQRIKNIPEIYEKTISKFMVLAEDDFKEIREIYIDPAISNVKTYRKIYGWVIFCLIVLMIGLIVGSYFMADLLIENLYPSSSILNENVE